LDAYAPTAHARAVSGGGIWVRGRAAWHPARRQRDQRAALGGGRRRGRCSGRRRGGGAQRPLSVCVFPTAAPQPLRPPSRSDVLLPARSIATAVLRGDSRLSALRTAALLYSLPRP